MWSQICLNIYRGRTTMVEHSGRVTTHRSTAQWFRSESEEHHVLLKLQMERKEVECNNRSWNLARTPPLTTHALAKWPTGSLLTKSMQVLCFISHPKDICQQHRSLHKQPAGALVLNSFAGSGMKILDPQHDSFQGLNFLIGHPSCRMHFHFSGSPTLKYIWKHCPERWWHSNANY